VCVGAFKVSLAKHSFSTMNLIKLGLILVFHLLLLLRTSKAKCKGRINQSGQCISYQPIDLENGPCVQFSNSFGTKKDLSAQRSKYERRSIGLDDKYFAEDESAGLRRPISGTATPFIPQANPTAVVVTDPAGKKHYLKGILHFKIQIPRVHPHLWFESVIVQVSRCSTPTINNANYDYRSLELDCIINIFGQFSVE